MFSSKVCDSLRVIARGGGGVGGDDDDYFKHLFSQR